MVSSLTLYLSLSAWCLRTMTHWPITLKIQEEGGGLQCAKKKKKMGFLLKLWRFMLFDPMPVSLGFAVNQKEKKVVSEDKCPGWEKKQKKTRLLSYTQTRTYIFPVGFIFLMTDHRERRQSSSPPRSNREILSSVSACPGGFLTRPFLPSSSRRRRRKHTAHLIF